MTINERKGENMDQGITASYDEYTNESLDRREFLKKLAVVAGSAAAANALLPLLERNHAAAQIVPKDDSRLHSEYIKYPVENGEARANVVRPKGEANLPGVVVIHENRGLNAHIEDVNRRIALEGFIAIAPDALSPVGGTPEDSDKAVSLIQLDRQPQ
jgi:carboxymethylenebutenolidase